ncbi:MAG: DNA mismatch endonuclease Vsr [Gammaproteobacteria bacterium]|nr:DNA mismatch endonuclease Vsr [Gammaproteobacteria bacterium]
MADTVSKSVRRKIMASVPQAHTKPERIVRSMLHGLGYRFGLHKRNLPGSPDIVLTRYKLGVFVHGCFWHQHSKCKYARRPSSRLDYWENKLDENVERDKRKLVELKHLGWKTLIIWQCETKSIARLRKKISRYMLERSSKDKHACPP